MLSFEDGRCASAPGYTLDSISLRFYPPPATRLYGNAATAAAIMGPSMRLFEYEKSVCETAGETMMPWPANARDMETLRSCLRHVLPASVSDADVLSALKCMATNEVQRVAEHIVPSDLLRFMHRQEREENPEGGGYSSVCAGPASLRQELEAETDDEEE